MSISRFHRVAAVGLAVVTVLTAAGCSAESDSVAMKAPLPLVSADQSLADRVPDEIKAKGTLSVGTNATFAPLEFMDDDGKTIVGLDADLAQAIATKLGLKFEMQSAEFGTLVLGVESGKYDMVAAGVTISDARMQQVDMVRYMRAGLQWGVQTGNPEQLDPDNMCGRWVSAQRDTVAHEHLEELAQQCIDQGKEKLVTVIEEDQSKATIDLISGKADAMLADSPVTNYAVERSEGALEPLGGMYAASPYGISTEKGTVMAELVHDALGELKDEGLYQKIFERWGNRVGEVSDFTINPEAD